MVVHPRTSYNDGGGSSTSGKCRTKGIRFGESSISMNFKGNSKNVVADNNENQTNTIASRGIQKRMTTNP